MSNERFFRDVEDQNRPWYIRWPRSAWRGIWNNKWWVIGVIIGLIVMLNFPAMKSSVTHVVDHLPSLGWNDDTKVVATDSTSTETVIVTPTVQVAAIDTVAMKERWEKGHMASSSSNWNQMSAVDSAEVIRFGMPGSITYGDSLIEKSLIYKGHYVIVGWERVKK